MATTTVPDLLKYLFDAKRPALYAEVEQWVRASRRFKTFADLNRAKIRTKLRNARDAGGQQDLRAEIQAAFALLQVEQFTLEYEKYAATGRRGPDFTVTFKTHTPFNVEVRRIRPVELAEQEPDAPITKLMAVLCEKMGQLPPSIINLLWLATEDNLSEESLARAVATLRQYAEQKADAYFVRRGYRSSNEFLKAFHRLSAILLYTADGNALWQNPLARHPIPTEIISALRRVPTQE